MNKISLAKKEQIGKKLQLGMTYKSIAEDLQISERVCRKWGQIIKRGDPLEPKMGRPCVGVLGSFSIEIKSAIEGYRPGVEGWGAVTIAVELGLDAAYAGLSKPSVSSINRYLKCSQKNRRYFRAEKLPDDPVIFPSHPHHVWQLDAEGNKQVKGVGPVSVINIKDTFSKVYVQSYPCLLASSFNHPKRKDYQFALRLGFLEFGLCDHLQTDHESIFYENTNHTPYPTNFHLWALGMGISVSFTPKAKPYKQGAVERGHQTMHQQVCAGRQFDGWMELFSFSQQRRHRLNHHIPCSTLGNRPPLQVFPEAISSGKPYDPAKEEEYFDLSPIYNYLLQGRWLRTLTAKKTFSLGGKTYTLKMAKPNSTVVVTFDWPAKEFCCSTADGALIQYIQPKGLSFNELCGDLEDFIAFSKSCPCINYPKTTQTRLFETLPDTTF